MCLSDTMETVFLEKWSFQLDKGPRLLVKLCIYTVYLNCLYYKVEKDYIV